MASAEQGCMHWEQTGLREHFPECVYGVHAYMPPQACPAFSTEAELLIETGAGHLAALTSLLQGPHLYFLTVPV